MFTNKDMFSKKETAEKKKRKHVDADDETPIAVGVGAGEAARAYLVGRPARTDIVRGGVGDQCRACAGQCLRGPVGAALAVPGIADPADRVDGDHQRQEHHDRE